MKKVLTLLSLAFILLLTNKDAKAQTPQINIGVFASQFPCNNPVQFNVGCSMYYLPVGTIMNINFDYGDGSSYSTTYTISNPISDTFGVSVNHTYSLAGTYTPITTVSGGGITETFSGLSSMFPGSIIPITVSAPGNCGNVSGKVYNDVNSNCVADPGEELANMYVEIDSAGIVLNTATTDLNGNYDINFQFTSGITYEVKYSSSFGSGCYTTVCPTAFTYLVSSLTSTNLDFGLIASGTAFDLEASYQGIQTNTVNSILTAGTNISLVAFYRNVLCMPQYGDLVITLDPSMNFTSATPTPTSVSGNTLTWSNIYTNPSTWAIGDFVVINAYLPFLNSASVPFVIGDSVNVQSSFMPISGVDADPSNNVLNKWYYIGTAYDPNDKHVYPKGKGVTGDIGFGTEFTYEIDFQNTGTAPAQQVLIKDTLDASLDPTTVQLVSNTHHVVFTQSGNILSFQFPNIMLPDSSTNFEKSMGSVTFKVKHKSSLAPNTSIHNKASIYFDANPPIVTANTNSRLVVPTGISIQSKSNEINVYPNPTTDFIHIESQYNLNSIELVNAVGDVVYKNHHIAGPVKINVNEFPKGVYVLKLIQSDLEVQNRKVMIR